jgi:catabolite repression HPr-like protein/phosphocarrier protein
MTDHYVTCRIRVPVDYGLDEDEAVLLSRSAREFPCELHITWGHRRVDAKSIIDMVDLSHELGEEVVLELEAQGDGSREALDCLSELVGHPRGPARARDELAYFGLVSAGRCQPGSSPGLTSLPARDALGAFALHPRAWRHEAQDPRELGRYGL